MLNSLGRFELVRRVLKHTAVLNLREEILHRPLWDPVVFQATLPEYARLLREAQQRATIPGFPIPVLPVVDIANQVVTHTTCTGNTVVEVTSGDSLFIMREWQDTPRDRVLKAIMSRKFDPAWFEELPLNLREEIFHYLPETPEELQEVLEL